MLLSVNWKLMMTGWGFGKLHTRQAVVMSESELSFGRNLNYVIEDGFTFCIKKLDFLLVYEVSKK